MIEPHSLNRCLLVMELFSSWMVTFSKDWNISRNVKYFLLCRYQWRTGKTYDGDSRSWVACHPVVSLNHHRHRHRHRHWYNHYHHHHHHDQRYPGTAAGPRGKTAAFDPLNQATKQPGVQVPILVSIILGFQSWWWLQWWLTLLIL